MFGNSSDFIPRTYAIKSFKKRKTLWFKKLLLYFVYFVVVIMVFGIAFLSFNHLV